MSDHTSVHGDDTPEGRVGGSDLQTDLEDHARRSPSEALTEAGVVGRRDVETDVREPDFADNDEGMTANALSDEQAARLPEDQDHPEGGKDLEVVAREVLDGKWGRGQERRMRLEDAGYKPNEVDEAVVNLLNPDPEEQAEASQERLEQARRNADDQSPDGQ